MYLANFENDENKKPVPQAESIQWLAQHHSYRSGTDKDQLVKMLERFGCGPKQISQRRIWIPEFSGQKTLFTKPVGLEQPSIEERMKVFKEQMGPSVQSLFEKTSNDLSHLLHVSCTGYASPSLAQELVLNKRWNTVVQHIYHMGCYAAIPAIRTAQGILATEEKAKVQILHTEFCSLHANMSMTTPEQLVVQSLFADACIKYEATNVKPTGRSFKLLSTHELLIPESQQDMSWELANFGFSMTLSRDVPNKIGQHLKGFLQTLFAKANLDPKELPTINAAIHPGGPKIIDAVKTILELSEDQVKYSKKVLFENGNMSSATVPFVWKEMLAQKEAYNSPYVLSLAFGPGLTIAGSLLCLQD